MKIFGRNYEEIGKDSSDFLIHTKGQVKIKWGNKFIDLIKDGKVNVELQKIINEVESVDKIPNKDGIYVVDGEVYIMSNGVLIPIVQSTDNSEYVSYLEQDKNGEEREMAQNNIGIVVQNMSKATSLGIKNGIVYVIDDLTLYLVKNGEFNPIKMEIPNPFTNPIVIKLSSISDYALYLEGYFSDNGTGLIIGNIGNGLHVYCETDGTYIDAASKIDIKINNESIVTITQEKIKVNTNIELNDGKYVQCNIFKTIGGSKDEGTYIEKGDIYCDNIYVRNKIYMGIVVTYSELRRLMANNKLKEGTTYYLSDYQNPWNIVDKIESNIIEDSSTKEEGSDNNDIDNIIPSKVKKYKNVFQLELYAISDCYVSQSAKMVDYPDVDIVYDVLYDDSVATGTDEGGSYEIKAKGRIIHMNDKYGNSAPFDFINARFNIDGKRLFAFGGETDKSRFGGFRNCVINGKFDDFRFDSEDNESNINYHIGNSAMISMYNKNGFNDILIKGLMGVLIINSENFKHNIISGFKGINTTISFSSENSSFIIDSLNSLSVSGDIKDFHIKSYDANNISISDCNNCDIKSNEIGSLYMSGCNRINIDADNISDMDLNNCSVNDMVLGTVNGLSVNGCDNTFIKSNNISNSSISCSNVDSLKIDSDSISGLSINCQSIKSTSIVSDSLNSLTLSGDISRLTIRSSTESLSISGCDNVYILGKLSNISFSKKLQFCTFHSDMTAVNFDNVDNNEYLYDLLKYADVYKNKDRDIIICIPDLASALIIGEIRMYHGDISKIPFGWHICDGTNGTPNLIGKFVRGANTYGTEGGGESIKIMLEKENLPGHSHKATTDVSISGLTISTGCNQGIGVSDRGVVTASFTAVEDTISNKRLRVGVYDKGGSENFAIYAGRTGNEHNYKLDSFYDIFNSLKISATGNGSGSTNISNEIDYTQKEIEIPYDKLLPKYYDIVFIMYTGK